MSKTYVLQFGSGDPRLVSGLSPTMILFYSSIGATQLIGPTIIETLPASGFYMFQYEPTESVTFLADGGAVLSSTDRYVTGVLDPIQAVDEKVGTLQDSFGSTGVDPSTVLGYLKRNQEFEEGNAVFNKSTAIWDIYSRGSSTLLAEKVLTNTISAATKS